MISLDVVCNVAGIVGNVFSVALFLSPAPTFYQIIKRKSSMQDFMPHPYLAALLNCSLWLFYALPSVSPDTTLLATVNGIGILIEAVYVGVFLVHAPSRERRLRTLAVLGGEAVFMAALVLGVLLGASTHEVRSTIVGNLCVVASSLMYASPLYVMRRVVKTKSVEYMLPFLQTMGLINGACWTTYAIIKSDLYIALPNVLGVLIGLAQLILYSCYYKSSPKKEKKAELPTIRTKPNATIKGGDISIDLDLEQQVQQYTQHYKTD